MRLITATLAVFFFQSALSQDPNFGFENTAGNNIAPWVRTRFSGPKYLIVPDSVVKHGGSCSMRFTYEPGNPSSTEGTIVQSLPVDVIGKKIRFSVWAKQSGPSDTAGLVSFIISSDRGEKKIGVKGFNIIGANEWTKYSNEFDLGEIHLPLHHARITAYPTSKDSLWLDDFRIEVDGKNMLDQPSFSSPAGEKPVLYTSQQINNLELLCKTWGFLKYYHPLVAEGKFNWDMELFRMLPLIENAKDNSEADKQIVTWINALGSIPVCKDCPADPPANSFTENIDLQWMWSDKLSRELHALLKHVFDNRHKGDGYYARYEPVKNLYFNENEYNWRDKNYPARKMRMQFLFRYWNTIQYFFPYKNIIGKDWNLVLREFIPVMAAAKDSVDYHIAMAKLVNGVNDSHSGNYDPILTKEFAALYLPVQIKVIDNKAVVSGFYNDTLAKLNGLEKGDIIEVINGKSIKQIIDERIEMANGSNYPTKLRTLTRWNFITGGKDSIVNIRLNRNGKTVTPTVRRYNYSSFYFKPQVDSTKWKILDNNIGWVNMGVLQKEEVEFVMDQLENTRGIIFDIRNYPHGTFYQVLAYLLPYQLPFAKVIYPDLDYPGNFLWSGARIVVGPTASMKNVYHYKGKVVMLVNETTQSHAEWTTMAFQTVPGSVTIGSQTSGADGNASSLYLTGNYFSYLTGLGVFYPGGTCTQRTGVKIDIEVKPSAEGIKNNRDELVEKAISVINN